MKITTRYHVASIADPHGEEFTVKREAMREAKRLNRQVDANYSGNFRDEQDYDVTQIRKAEDGTVLSYADVDLDTGHVDR